MSRHLLFIILISASLSACVQRNDFKAYRYNPFQYPYPEYYIEADTITVEAVTILDFQDMGRIEFFNKTAYIPMNLLDPTPISANDDKVIFKKTIKF